MFHEILGKNCGALGANTLSSESCVNALVLSRGVKCKQMWSVYFTVREKKRVGLNNNPCTLYGKKIFFSFTIKVLSVSYFNFVFGWNAHVFHNNGYCQ